MSASLDEPIFGALPLAPDSTRFGVWAPGHTRIAIAIDGRAEPVALTRARDGWHVGLTEHAPPGFRYRIALPDGTLLPDPASRFQPDGVHAASEVIDLSAYRWHDTDWRGRPWHEAVIYELHIGSFSPEGTFRGAIERLSHLVTLGITAIQLMPVAAFAGERGWGYDGVCPYATHAAYGRPSDLQAFVDAAHARGLMVLLDVVYNHFGPEGAYVHALAPETFTDRHLTPWGAAIDLDGPRSRPVREFIVRNALQWIEDFHFDGLRLDAVHALRDDSDTHLLTELAHRVRERVASRQVHLVLENEHNESTRLARDADGKPVQYTAQWNDDVHHVLHVAATGETEGYYADYHGDSDRLGRALAQGFAYQGEIMGYSGRARGEPSEDTAPVAFVAFTQNHDQIGNRAFGERLNALAAPQAVRAVNACCLLLPQVPMLFMGEEWSTSRPFPFFCDLGDELAPTVREGRRREFARFERFSAPAARALIPDPNARATFESARLDWAEIARPEHTRSLERYRALLGLRQRRLVPLLPRITRGGRWRQIGPGALEIRWAVEPEPAQESRHDSLEWVLELNLGSEPCTAFAAPNGEVLWTEGLCESSGVLGPWSVRASLQPGPDALASLAELAGIDTVYVTATGERRHAQPDTQRSLLAAMGLDAGDDARCRSTLQALQTAPWRRMLAPVHVQRGEPTALSIPITLPLSCDALRFTLLLEDGSRREMAMPRERLGLLAQRRLGEAGESGGSWTVERRLLRIAPAPAHGYHRLDVLTADGQSDTMPIVHAPTACHLPAADASGPGLWGVAAQLYLLRGERDAGIGDFDTLHELIDQVAAQGASAVGLNPLHALFVDAPHHTSPYAPASRLLLDPLMIAPPDPSAAQPSADTDPVLGTGTGLDAAGAEDADLLDRAAVTARKLPALRHAFDFSRVREDRAWQAFTAFRHEQGPAFERHCLYLALRGAHAHDQTGSATDDWRHWPQALQDPASPAVAAFAIEHGDEIGFIAWLQWLADRQLQACAQRCAHHRMAIGLYRDLAVGAHRNGAESWADTVYRSRASVGAPPDLLNTAGQDWGLPPIDPHALRARALQPFIELVRANMRHAGGLRIDHVMGLQRLYWIPHGSTPDKGAYVRYPIDEMLAILALESRRARCVVIGEDLGTVPHGLRERLAAANVLSCRVLFFEREADGIGFLAPDAYPEKSLAVTGSHDLATLVGWWTGHDITLRHGLRLLDDQEKEHAMRTRRSERRALIEALRSAGLEGRDTDLPDTATIAAVHAFLARTRSMIVMAQIEDLAGIRQPVNLPGTTDAYPNWRRRLPTTLRALGASERWAAVCAAMRAGRA